MSGAVSLHAPLLTARYGFFAQVSYASADVGSIPTVSTHLGEFAEGFAKLPPHSFRGPAPSGGALSRLMGYTRRTAASCPYRVLSLMQRAARSRP
jgi:hypothetical protein